VGRLAVHEAGGNRVGTQHIVHLPLGEVRLDLVDQTVVGHELAAAEKSSEVRGEPIAELPLERPAHDVVRADREPFQGRRHVLLGFCELGNGRVETGDVFLGAGLGFGEFGDLRLGAGLGVGQSLKGAVQPQDVGGASRR
jgi:hypothetical protein